MPRDDAITLRRSADVKQMKVYCDTNTLAPNIRDPACLPELEALKRLRALQEAGAVVLLRSRAVLAELEKTPTPEQREKLRADYELLEHILKDEKLLGFNTQYDQYGGFISSPMVADVQDEKLCSEIYEKVKQRDPAALWDARHIAQAISNGCDVFLTRDISTIIKPIGQWLERQFPPLKVRLPSQLVAEIERGC